MIKFWNWIKENRGKVVFLTMGAVMLIGFGTLFSACPV